MTARQFLSRLLGQPARRRGNRFAPRLEQLEGREVPVVDVVFSGTLPNFNEDVPFQFGPAAYFVINNSDDPSSVFTHTATIVAQNGVLNVTVGTGLSATGNGTSTVTVTGTRDNITQLFLGANGSVTFVPIAFYSGDGRVTVSATDGTTSDTDFTQLKVQPVLSQNVPTLFFDPGAELFVTPGGFADFEQVPVPPFGTLLDSDGSESVGYYIDLYSADESPLPAFTLLSNGVPYPTAGSPNSWFVGSNNSAVLRAVLNSFVLVPPPGFSGSVFLDVSATHDDYAFFSDESVGFDSSPVVNGAIFLRFFSGPQVLVNPGLAPEGGTIDLAGRFALSDPDANFADLHTFRVTATSGTLGIDTTNPILSFLTVTATPASVELTGDLSDIQQFLNTPGALTFTADSAYFSGVLPLRVFLVNRPGGRFSEGQSFGPLPFAPLAFDQFVPMGFTPVAAPLTPVVADVDGTAGTALALSIAVPPVVDTDGSESVTVFLTGLPTDAVLSAGTDLGGGVWAVSSAQLAGLLLFSSTSGTYTLTAVALVRDVAPSLGLLDEAVRSSSFVVTLDDSNAFGESSGDGATVLSEAQGDGGGPEGGISDFIDNEDFDPRGTDRGPGNAPVRIGAFNLVEVPVNLRDLAPPPDPGANPAAPREAALAPIYGGGEKHPLPPVLPLDQSVPVAGFSDSGGDSFALLDRMYRGEFGAQPVAVNAPTPVPGAIAEAPPPHEPGVRVAEATPETAQVPDPVAAPVDVDAGANWRVWAVAGAAVLGSAAAYAVYARSTRTPSDTPARANRPRAAPEALREDSMSASPNPRDADLTNANTGASNPSLTDAGGPTDVTVVRGKTPAPTVADAAPPAGNSFGKYELLGELARGGMGVVYRARQPGLDRVVALKMVLGSGGGSESAQRFLQEARAAAALDHPNVVPIYDTGEIDGKPYFTMALIDGPNLKAHVEKRLPVPIPEVVSLFAQIVAGVAHAHQADLIHRDLKPANVLIDRDGRARVTDFGLAKRLTTESQLTQNGQVLGTPHYMAPEQARDSKDVGKPADVYALGAILHFLLTGKPPFHAESYTDLLIKLVTDPPVPPQQERPDVPDDLNALCLSCLAKDPAARPADAVELAEALAPILDAHRGASSASTPALARLNAPRLPASGTTPSFSAPPLHGTAHDLSSTTPPVPTHDNIPTLNARGSRTSTRTDRTDTPRRARPSL